MAQCPSCGAGLTKKEIHKAVYGANPQSVNHSTIGFHSDDVDVIPYGVTVLGGGGASFTKPIMNRVSREVIEVTYECMFCGNVYEEWELKQKKETLEMNGIESDMMEFLIGDK